MVEVRGPRIPAALQQVFLASNRGKEIHKPPPGNLADRVFKRTWFWQKKSASITSQHDAQPPKQQKDKSKRLVVRKKKEKKKRSDSSGESPLVYLLAILESRGYSIAEFPALETAYHCTPTPIQEASYGGHLIDVVRRGERTQLRSLMASGLSPNACNQHGESLVHMACRRGEAECLGVLIEYGATLQIADDYGRTPLHDACWAAVPNFEVVEIIIQQDVRLFALTDGRNQSPLSYVRRDMWKTWKKFLLAKCDIYWPTRDLEYDGPEEDPPLVLGPPNSRVVPGPKETLPLELAAMVAQGKMDPSEAMMLRHENQDDDSTVGETSSTASDDDSDYDSEDDESEFSFDEDEMALILQNVGGTVPHQWKN